MMSKQILDESEQSVLSDHDFQTKVTLLIREVNTYAYFYEYRSIKIATLQAMEDFPYNREDCLLSVLHRLLRLGFPYRYSEENEGSIVVLRPSTGEILCKVI